MARIKGSQKTGGRKAGTPNKMTTDIKNIFLEAFQLGGGVGWLVRQMEENPVAFINAFSRCIPRDIRAEVTGTLEMVLVDDLREARERAKRLREAAVTAVVVDAAGVDDAD